MTRTFGMPYMGSKSSIAEWVIDKLPKADVFVEPFAGGGAITHAAMLSGKYKRIIANDITDSALVFKDAIRGRFRNEKRWISRDDFKRLKDTDPYVRMCFSFGNDQNSYCYGKNLEAYKRAFHYAVVFRDKEPFMKLGVNIPNKAIESENQTIRRLKVKSYLIWLKNNMHAGDLQRLESLEGLQRLQSLESLERLESLEGLQSLQSLESHQGDYSQVIIPDNSVIYCDPPYRGTHEYLNSFDWGKFDDWCLGQSQQVFISEYSMPKDKFKRIAAMNKRSLMCSDSRVLKTESIYVPLRDMT